MSLKFSNKTCKPKIICVTKPLSDDIACMKCLLFKISASYFPNDFLVKRTKLKIIIQGSKTNYNYTINNINHNTITDITMGNLFIYVDAARVSKDSEKESGTKIEEIDVKDLFKDFYNSSSFSFCFAIVFSHDSNVIFNVSIDSSDEFLLGEVYSPYKEFSNHETKSLDFGFVGTGSVDLFTRKLFFNVLNINTMDKNPISLSALYNHNEDGFFGKNIKASFEYKVVIEESYIELIDYYNESSYFELTNRQDAIDNYDIDPDEVNGSLFINYSDFSFIVLDGSYLYLYNKREVKIRFALPTYSYGSLIFINITRVTTSKGIINYTWESNLLKQIGNGKSIIKITYTNNYITRIDYDKSRYCLFEYYTYYSNKYLYRIKYCDNYDPLQTEVIHEVSVYEYDTNTYNLIYAYDNLTKIGAKIDYNNGVVESVYTYNKKNNEYQNSLNFLKSSNVTKVTNEVNEEEYYYFDEFGNCYLKLDSNAKGSSIDYLESNIYGSNFLIEKEAKISNINYNYIKNPCFFGKINDTYPYFEISVWTNRNLNYATYNRSLGINGRPSLRIYDLRTSVALRQNIVNASSLAGKTVNFSGYIRGTGRIKVNLIIDDFDHCSYFTVTNSWEKFEISDIELLNNLGTIVVDIEVEEGSDVRLCEITLEEEGNNRINYIINSELDDSYLSTDCFYGWDKTNFVSSDTASDIELNSPLNKQIKRQLTLNGDVDDIKELSQIIDVSGCAGETLTFSFFARTNTTLDDICYSYIIVNYLKENAKPYLYNIKANGNNYSYITHTITTESDFSFVKVGIIYKSSYNSYFASFGFFKDNLYSYYSYDEKNSLLDINNQNNNINLDFDENYKLKRFFGKGGEVFEYSYLENGEVSKITDLNGNEFSFIYDENDNLTNSVIKTSNNKRLIFEQTCDKNGNILYQKDYDGTVNAFEYDDRERIIKRNSSNGLVEYFSYNDLDFITNKKYRIGNTRVNHNFLYNNNHNLSEVSINSGSKYEYSLYDDWGNLSNLILDNRTLNNFTYYKHDGIYTGLLSSKVYSNGTYSFNYDAKHRLSSVNYGNNNVASFYYNDENELIKKVDSEDTTNYNYDFSNRLINKSINSKNLKISYEYDNLNSLEQKTIKINNNILNYNYAYNYEYNEYSSGGYFSRLDNYFSNDYILEDFRLKYGEEPLLNNLELVKDNDLNRKVFRFTSTSDSLIYDIFSINFQRKELTNKVFKYSEWQDDFSSHKSIVIWIKPNNFLYGSTTKILSLGSNSSEIASISYNNSGRVIVNYNGVSYDYFYLTLGEWNLVGIELEKLVDEVDESIISTKVTQIVNDKKRTVTVNGSLVPSIWRVMFGEFRDSTVTLEDLENMQSNTISFDILYASFSNNSDCINGSIGIYNEGYKNVFSYNRCNAQGVIYYNHSLYNDLDVIPLNGCLTSVRGLKPLSYAYSDSSFKLNKTKLFKLDNKRSNIDNSYTNKHVYGSYKDEVGLDGKTKSILAYDFGMKTQGFISFRFKLDRPKAFDRYTLRTLICVPSNYNVGHALLIQIDNYSQCITLSSNASNSTFITNITVSLDEWHLFSFTWKNSYFTIYLDNQYDWGFFSNSIDLTDLATYIGCNYLNNEPFNQLNGAIEMLSFSNSYMTNKHATLVNGGAINHITNIDELERPISKEIITNSNRFIHKYLYYDESVETNNDEYYKASSRPSIEELEDGTNIIYSYDSIGNITKKVSSKNGVLGEVVSYKYDESNRLIDELSYNGSTFNYHLTYNYNNNGDILSIIRYNSSNVGLSKSEYVYDQTVKGKLIRINYFLYDIDHWEYVENVVNSYTNNDPFRPSNYKGYSLSWEGRRLTQFGYNTYTYNSDGIRISKVTSSGTYSYILDGKLIVKETKPNYGDIYYHYDSNGLLVGFHYDGNEYFYVRDLTGNIIKVLDEDGNIKVEYKYNAWGKVLSITGDNTIKNVNSFLYKGYYYDSEVCLYYCNSRYYDPDVCRWISIDDIEYLDPESVNGLNLYCYCFNNPIMYVDPDGHMPKWLENTLKIGGAVLLTAALVAGSIFIAGPASIILAGAALGAAGGLIGGGISSGISSVMSGGSFIDGFADGALSGSITGAISGAVAASPLGVLGQVGVNALISGGSYIVNNYNNFNIGDFLFNSALGGLAGFVGGDGWTKAGSTLAYDLVFNGIKGSFMMLGRGALNEFSKPIIKSSIVGSAGFINDIFKKL